MIWVLFVVLLLLAFYLGGTIGYNFGYKIGVKTAVDVTQSVIDRLDEETKNKFTDAALQEMLETAVKGQNAH